MQSRSDLFSLAGGDSVQVEMTAIELRKLGADIDIIVANRNANLYKKYDLVHLFNSSLVSENHLSLKQCKKNGVPVVVSPIFFPLEDVHSFEISNTFGLSGKITKILALIGLSGKAKEVHHLLKNMEYSSMLKTLFKSYYSMMKHLLYEADMLLPNSEMESSSIKSMVNIPQENISVVPNGVVLSEESCKKEEILSLFPWLKSYKKIIVVAGRIEARKNQIAAMNALTDVDACVIFAGALPKSQKAYIEKFNGYLEKYKHFRYVGLLTPDVLNSLYDVADVTLLPSWFETTGLVGLEGAANNCQIVITERGYTREYYQDYAYYCAPDDVVSIRDAVYRALESPKNISPLIDKIKENYTWARAARETLNAYKAVLNKKNPNG